MSQHFVNGPVPRAFFDLNTLLPPNSPWVLTKAQSINDVGVIVGYGEYSERATAWILYPQCQD